MSTRATRLSKLPRIRVDDPNLQRYLDAMASMVEVREGLSNNKDDAFISWRDLVGTRLVKKEAGRYIGTVPPGFEDGGLQPGDGSYIPGMPIYDVPPEVDGLTAAGAVQNIILSWRSGLLVMGNWSHDNVYRSDTPVIGEAVKIGQSTNGMYADNVGPGHAYWYWVSYVNTDEVEGPLTPVDGVYAETSIDTAYTLEQLTGEITASQLHQNLTSRIDLIDASATVEGSVAWRVLQEEQARVAALIAEAEDRDEAIADAEERMESYADTDSAAALAVQTLTSQFGGNASQAMNFVTTHVDSELAVSSRLDTLDAEFGGSVAGALNHITTHVDENSALSQNIRQYVAGLREDNLLLDGTFALSARDGPGVYWASREPLTFASTGGPNNSPRAIWEFGGGALSSQALNPATGGWLQPSASVGDRFVVRFKYRFTGVEGSGNRFRIMVAPRNFAGSSLNWPSIYTDQTAEGVWHTREATVEITAADTAWVWPYMRIEEGITAGTIEIADLSITRAASAASVLEVTERVTDVEAEWTIKTDVNGNVAGIGLMNDGATSSFGVLADQFYIAHPNGGSDLMPFVVDGGTVYIANAAIANASIGAAKFEDGVFDNLTAEHGEITFANIARGNVFDLAVDNLIQGGNYPTSGWRITRAGDAVFNSGTFRGLVEGATIQGSVIIATQTVRPTDAGDPYFTYYNSVAKITNGDRDTGTWGVGGNGTGHRIRFPSDWYAFNSGPTGVEQLSRVMSQSVTAEFDIWLECPNSQSLLGDWIQPSVCHSNARGTRLGTAPIITIWRYWNGSTQGTQPVWQATVDVPNTGSAANRTRETTSGGLTMEVVYRRGGGSCHIDHYGGMDYWAFLRVFRIRLFGTLTLNWSSLGPTGTVGFFVNINNNNHNGPTGSPSVVDSSTVTIRNHLLES